jgi:hypothetical protein
MQFRRYQGVVMSKYVFESNIYLDDKENVIKATARPGSWREIKEVLDIMFEKYAVDHGYYFNDNGVTETVHDLEFDVVIRDLSISVRATVDFDGKLTSDDIRKVNILVDNLVCYYSNFLDEEPKIMGRYDIVISDLQVDEFQRYKVDTKPQLINIEEDFTILEHTPEFEGQFELE